MPNKITTPKPYLKVYPSPDSIFASPVENYAKNLLPLVSIDLSVINSDWAGWVHMVNPIEPIEGTIGNLTQPYHSYYCRDNWIGFHLNEDNKYEWLSDWRYFLLENVTSDNQVTGLPDIAENDSIQNIVEELKEDYQHQHTIYKLAKDAYAKEPLLYSLNYLDPKSKVKQRIGQPKPLIEQLGIPQSWGNWIDSSDMPLDKSNADDIVPVTPDSKRFHFIAGVPAYNYCAMGADWILLFYEPLSRTVLLTFDWT